ncbi:MAG: carbohydrate-binding protein [Methylomonas sp.]|nr:carbohydrate-binding protein [Methylomonas sp.]
MEKRVSGDIQAATTAKAENWLDLDTLASVEVSSENPDRPIEAALLPGFKQGWQAGEPGEQTIRLLFGQAHYIRCVQLEFLEAAVSRTQEYVLRMSQDSGATFREIVRQQWNFSPDGSTAESAMHFVDMAGVTTLELKITPDIGNPLAVATLEKMRVFEVFSR